LLAASLLFYASLGAPRLLGYLLASAAISYTAGIRLGQANDETSKRRWLWLGIGAQILLLVCAKYLPFLSNTLNYLAAGLGLKVPVLSQHVSIGVSFFVFQAVGYLVDVYLEREGVERHFGHFLLGLAFFPKILQGPIERTGELIKQFRQPYLFSYDNVRSGMVLFASGLFKKVVLADRLALFSDEVFNNVHSYAGPAVAVGVYAYAFQIFLDFSAYTDMALGSARILGICLTPNFDRPYLATSVADFWRRWHITFSRWILENIFKPLQMSWRNQGRLGTTAALLVTFGVSGLWHGASWTFVAWGVFHGILLSVGTVWRDYQKRLLARVGLTKSAWVRWIQILVTFHLVCLGWILFRSSSFEDAWYLVMHLWAPVKGLSGHQYFEKVLLVNQSWRDALIVVLGCAAMPVGERLLRAGKKEDIGNLVGQRSLLFRWSFYMTLVIAMIGFGVFTSPPFIYYRF